MKVDYEEIKGLPEVISKEQMRTVCHISKHTAFYLLHSGLIPCEVTGKKTHKYNIKKSDLLDFIKKWEQQPELFIPPENWYSRNNRPYRIGGVRIHPSRRPTPKQLRSYYNLKLYRKKEILDIQDIVKITGYNRRTISLWIRSGKLKPLMLRKKYFVAKADLIDFLCGKEYYAISRKSDKHLQDLWEIYYSNGRLHDDGLYY